MLQFNIVARTTTGRTVTTATIAPDARCVDAAHLIDTKHPGLGPLDSLQIIGPGVPEKGDHAG